MQYTNNWTNKIDVCLFVMSDDALEKTLSHHCLLDKIWQYKNLNNTSKSCNCLLSKKYQTVNNVIVYSMLYINTRQDKLFIK